MCIPQERLQVWPKINCARQGHHQRDKTQMVLVIVLKWEPPSLRSRIKSHAEGMHQKVRNIGLNHKEHPKRHRDTHTSVVIWNFLCFEAKESSTKWGNRRCGLWSLSTQPRRSIMINKINSLIEREPTVQTTYRARITEVKVTWWTVSDYWHSKYSPDLYRQHFGLGLTTREHALRLDHNNPKHITSMKNQCGQFHAVNSHTPSSRLFRDFWNLIYFANETF